MGDGGGAATRADVKEDLPKFTLASPYMAIRWQRPCKCLACSGLGLDDGTVSFPMFL